MKKLNYRFAKVVGSFCLAVASFINVIGVNSLGLIGSESDMPESMKKYRM